MFDGDHLDADLDLLRNDPETAGDVDLIDAFLTEVAESEDTKWTLLKWRGETDSRPFLNCKAVRCFIDAKFNIYRLRPLRGRLSPYRVFYAYDAARNEIHLLAVVKKTPVPPPLITKPFHYAYEPKHAIADRIRDEYEQRGFTKLP